MESSAGKVITHCMLLIVCALFFVVVVVVVVFVFYRAKSSSIMAANHPKMELTKTTRQFYYGHVYGTSHKNLMVIIVEVIYSIFVQLVDSFQYLPHSQLHFLKLYMHVFTLFMLWWSL